MVSIGRLGAASICGKCVKGAGQLSYGVAELVYCLETQPTRVSQETLGLAAPSHYLWPTRTAAHTIIIYKRINISGVCESVCERDVAR